jgi:hypothetical protein
MSNKALQRTELHAVAELVALGARSNHMKPSILLLSMLVLLPVWAALSEQSAPLSFGEAEKALQKALEYIDSGKVQFKGHTIKREDVEVLCVSYGFDAPEKQIAVDFRVKSTVKSNYFEYVFGVLSVYLDDHGRLRGQTAGERHSAAPNERWKITP